MVKDDALPALTSTLALTHWLHTHQIDTTTWGQGAAKQVADLWQELVAGESTLQADPPLRCVAVVEVIVEREGQRLVETAQHFADGRVRARNRPPSEKLKPGETPLAAAQRCLVEELAIEHSRITVAQQAITQRITLDESGSYPGLTTRYTFYCVYLQVAGLPTTPFTTENAAHGHGDPVTAHQWGWLPTG
jgi:8-oxo-dGTP pyrophosphatase MutT (NUDIX family)